MHMDTHYFAEKEVEKKWYVIDASNQVLGRLADEVARILIGKNKPEYTPNADMGDFVIVVNANKILVSGAKENDKIYYRHSLYPGGLKKTPLWRMRQNDASYMIRKAVWGMIKHTPLGRKCFRKLKVYNRPDHEHEAQKPIKLEL